MAVATPNFVLLTDDELANLLDDADSSNTKKQIKYALHRMDSFARYAGTTLAAVESYDIVELDKFLSRFYAGLRKDDGELYTKKSMQAIRYGIQRHFTATKNVDVCKADLFKESNRMFKAMLVKLKQCGKGVMKHKKAVSKDDLAKIFDSLDQKTPIGLQNKVFLDIMIYFANRGRENLRSMTITDFNVEVDENNLRYIVYRDTMTKCRRENEDEDCSGHMYEIPGSSRCPVTSFLALKMVLNPAETCMWQRPKVKAPVDESPWYTKAPLGINTIGDKMKKISEKAGCSQKYTNHSLRATTVTLLDEAGFPNRHIMSVTGHRSESSLKHYSRTSDKKKKFMSTALANQLTETAPKSSDNVLTESQEQTILNECNYSFNNATSSSSVQNFHFNGPVTFYNKA